MDNNSERDSSRPTWAVIGRVVLIAAFLFIIFNLVFAALQPLESLGQLTLYNWLLQGRDRLPYGEDPAESYNLSLNNIPAMISSHSVSRPKAEDEFRIIIIGDSGTWGWLLENEDTLAGQINDGAHMTEDGRRIVAYNLGYPIMALSKDLLILDAALELDPDLILWPVTLESFPKDKQLIPPIVVENPDPMRTLISDYGLSLDPGDPAFTERGLLDETIVGRRRELADLLRLQLYGFSWQATAIDQTIPDEHIPRKSDFEEDPSWGSFNTPSNLTESDLSFDILSAGSTISGDVPILFINEPIFISDGKNSDIHYNAWYPRWAYDQYRELLSEYASSQDWRYVDLWDTISAEEFTDSPVHLTEAGMREFTQHLLPHILSIANE